jgi:DNA-binding NarL/FixJ family response regulator
MLGEMSFDLLLLDLGVATVGGFELIRHALCLHPDTRVILMTGCAGTGAAFHDAGLVVSDCLDKAVLDPRVVEHAIETALRQPPATAPRITDGLASASLLPDQNNEKLPRTRPSTANGAPPNGGGLRGDGPHSIAENGLGTAGQTAHQGPSSRRLPEEATRVRP